MSYIHLTEQERYVISHLILHDNMLLFFPILGHGFNLTILCIMC